MYFILMLGLYAAGSVLALLIWFCVQGWKTPLSSPKAKDAILFMVIMSWIGVAGWIISGVWHLADRIGCWFHKDR